MNCEICGREVHGDIQVVEGQLPSGAWFVRMIETPDRDWICCDSCNKLVCHDCCQHPKTGYCDTCIDKYNLLELAFVETCDPEDLEQFLEAKQEEARATKGRRHTRFMKDEAESKVGKTVRSLVDFAGVPKGTTGRVVEIGYLADGWDVVIEWDLPRPEPSAAIGKIAGEPVLVVHTGRPLRDWFTKQEYEEFLEEV